MPPASYQANIIFIIISLLFCACGAAPRDDRTGKVIQLEEDEWDEQMIQDVRGRGEAEFLRHQAILLNQCRKRRGTENAVADQLTSTSFGSCSSEVICVEESPTEEVVSSSFSSSGQQQHTSNETTGSANADGPTSSSANSSEDSPAGSLLPCRESGEQSPKREPSPALLPNDLAHRLLVLP